LEARITEWFGPVDGQLLKDVRGRQITKPYYNDFVENRFDEVLLELVQEVCGEELSEDQLSVLERDRMQAFHDSISAEAGVAGLLQALQAHYRLGFISNYPCGESIRDSLRMNGLNDFFEAIVISGEVGRIKPHPSIYQELLDQMNISPEACVYIGDNWLADVQGAKRMGMRAIHIQQHDAYESFDREADHMEADAVITNLHDLLDVFGLKEASA